MRKIIPAHLNSFITLQDLGDGGDDTISGLSLPAAADTKKAAPIHLRQPLLFSQNTLRRFTSVDITFYRLSTVGTNRHYLYRSLKLFLQE